MCEGALGRAASGNGVNPIPYAVCGFCLSALFLPPIVGVFLSFPVMTHILPAPNHSFSHVPLRCLPRLFGNHLLRDSTVLSLPFTWPLLSVPSLHCQLLLCYTPFLVPLCPALSLMFTSFLPGIVPHIPCSVLFPRLPPALRSQRRWQPRCRMREGAPRPGSRSRPRSPAAL